MKLYVHVTDADQFLSGNYGDCWYLSNRDASGVEGWQLVGSIEFEPDVDCDELRAHAVECIDEKIKEVRAEMEVKLDMLDAKKQSLLAIAHNPEGVPE